MALFVSAFGAAFGLAAQQQGLEHSTSLLMSVFVFTGTAQFAVLDLWGEKLPLFTILVSVFAINARHLLMGATLYPWLIQRPLKERYLLLLFASDANWALSLQAFNRNQPGFGILLGGGIALWFFWVLGTLLGLYFGDFISDPKRYGFDMVMGCFLLAMLLDTEKDLAIYISWLAAGLSALLAYYLLPENSHVVVGAMVGGIAGTYFSIKKTNTSV